MSLVSLFFFFKQKTAYEMRISDWSSDVCSSDLALPVLGVQKPAVSGLHGPNVLINISFAHHLSFSFDMRSDHVRLYRLCYPVIRSEEHTSELQSLMRNSYAVFCLNKKNKNFNQKNSHQSLNNKFTQINKLKYTTIQT